MKTLGHGDLEIRYTMRIRVRDPAACAIRRRARFVTLSCKLAIHVEHSKTQLRKLRGSVTPGECVKHEEYDALVPGYCISCCQGMLIRAGSKGDFYRTSSRTRRGWVKVGAAETLINVDWNNRPQEGRKIEQNGAWKASPVTSVQQNDRNVKLQTTAVPRR